MRKLLSILVLSATLMLLLVPSAAADGYMEVMPGDAEFAATFGSDSFGDLWIELEGVGHEVPGGDDFIRGGPVGGWAFWNLPQPDGGWMYAVYQHGIPLGFEVEFWGESYEEVWLSTNGYALFRSPVPSAWNGGLEFYYDWDWWNSLSPAEQLLWSPIRARPFGDSWNWWPWQLGIAEPPNNFVAPYWTDLWIGDNGFKHVVDVKLKCWDLPIIGEWCEYLPIYEVVERPRGYMLFDTVGEEPNRIFVAEWLHAKNAHTGNLATFQAQMFEGSNAILFLYRDFVPKTEFAAYFEIPSVIAGLEDAPGFNAAGSLYAPPGFSDITQMYPFIPGGREWAFTFWQPTGPYPKGSLFFPWQWILGFFNIQYPYLPQPFAAGDMLGFIPS